MSCGAFCKFLQFFSTTRHDGMLKRRRMPAAAPSFANVALVGNDRDPRVVESMQILAVHLHARGRKIIAESDSTVDFAATRVERKPSAMLAEQAQLVVAIGGDGTMLHAARLA